MHLRQDSFKHIGLRKRMIETIKSQGISNLSVLDALAKIPRHLFVDITLEEMAYQDKALPIGENQTISAPSMVALQTSLLNIEAGDKVLEVGTGSGYQAAVLITLGANLYSVERQKPLFTKTSALLKKLNYQGHFYFGDGFEGIPAEAPFDKIILTAGAPSIPESLLNQLKVGGIMIAPIGVNNKMQIVKVLKDAPNHHQVEYLNNCVFVPMLSGVVNK